MSRKSVVSVLSLSATITITGLPERRGFKDSTKACSLRSDFAASAGAGGNGSRYPQLTSTNVIAAAIAANAHLLDMHAVQFLNV